MKYLITGATGFVGQHLIKKLLSDGHKCKCLVRSASELKISNKSQLEIITGDIVQPETLTGITQDIDYLIHLAATLDFNMPENLIYKINVQGTINVMHEALISNLQKIVHCSSVAAMGICNEIPATENSKCYPHHTYGKSKLQAEKEVQRMVLENKLPAVLLRFPIIYGPGEKRDILTLTRLAQKGMFPIVGKKPKLTPLIHVDDVIQGILLAAEKGKAGEIYLMANKHSERFDRIREIIYEALNLKKQRSIYIPEWFAFTIATVIESYFVILKKSPPISRKKIKSTLTDRVFSIEKAIRELGFDPKVDPTIGLRETIEWYKKEGLI